MTALMPKNFIAFVINLERAPERRAFMEEQLRRLGIPFRILNATDGATYSFRDEDARAHFSNNEKACAHSHRRAYQEFLKSDAKYCLVMEDDVELDARFPGTLARILEDAERNPDVWDYVQCDYAPSGWKGIVLWWFLFLNMATRRKSEPSFWVTLPLYLIKSVGAVLMHVHGGIREFAYHNAGSSTIIRARRDYYLAGCYLITKGAGATLIELNSPITRTADEVHNTARRLRKLKHYVLVPRLARQKREAFASSLNNKHFGNPIISY